MARVRPQRHRKKKKKHVFQLKNIFGCSAGVSCEGVLIMVCEVKFFVLSYLVRAVYKIVNNIS